MGIPVPPPPPCSSPVIARTAAICGEATSLPLLWPLPVFIGSSPSSLYLSWCVQERVRGVSDVGSLSFVFTAPTFPTLATHFQRLNWAAFTHCKLQLMLEPMSFCHAVVTVVGLLGIQKLEFLFFLPLFKVEIDIMTPSCTNSNLYFGIFSLILLGIQILLALLNICIPTTLFCKFIVTFNYTCLELLGFQSMKILSSSVSTYASQPLFFVNSLSRIKLS